MAFDFFWLWPTATEPTKQIDRHARVCMHTDTYLKQDSPIHTYVQHTLTLKPIDADPQNPLPEPLTALGDG